MRRRASAASDRSTVGERRMRANDSLILIRLSSCLGVAVIVCTQRVIQGWPKTPLSILRGGRCIASICLPVLSTT